MHLMKKSELRLGRKKRKRKWKEIEVELTGSQRQREQRFGLRDMNNLTGTNRIK